MRHFPFSFAIGFVLAGGSAVFGCGGSSGGSGFGDLGSDDGGGGGGGNGDGGGGGTSLPDGGINLGDTSTGTSGCSAAAELVYVFATDNSIYSFDPPTKTFTKIATADCQTGSMMPNSMAIDRNLVAWLNYFDSSDNGSLYKFDLNVKSGCSKAASLSNGYGQVGMGFSSDTSGGTAETLYLDGIGGNAGLASFDMTSNSVVPIGTFTSDPNLTGQSAELTGTGDARLFGYFTTSPDVRVAQLSKTNANVLSDTVLNNFPPPADWAFSFWGGDFYLYTSDGVSNSSVVHYSPGPDTVDLSYVSDVGFTIIGAGVSTCAPVTPPQ
jgi:hypothetical protein